MKQYLHLLQEVKEKGTYKPAARENLPGTTSLFGHQFRHNLQEGFPLLTTKKVSFKNIVAELLWFLKGDTNIKYLVDNGCNIWNEDAYNYYKKFITKYCDNQGGEPPFGIVFEDILNNRLRPYTFEEFVDFIKNTPREHLPKEEEYVLGDCGKQYGWLWRNWSGTQYPEVLKINTVNLDEEQIAKFKNEWSEAIKNSQQSILVYSDLELEYVTLRIDQIKDVLNGLLNNPTSRRHIITAWNPVTLDDMALNACHALVQFNCRPIPWETRLELAKRNPNIEMENLAITEAASGNTAFGFVPQYYLDCQMYQRSADVFLGVPYNIASYSLLTMIFAQVCNMVPGEFIHSFGDVHIYENHVEAVNLQLERKPDELPKLLFSDKFHNSAELLNARGVGFLDTFIDGLQIDDFKLENYNPQPAIKAKLSTGLK